MLILDDIKSKYKELKDKFDSCAAAVDLSALKARREEVEKEQQSPDLYSDLKRAQAVGSEAKYLDTKIALVEGLTARLKDVSEFIELAEIEGDESIVAEIESSLSSLDTEIEDFHLQTLLKGEYDRNSAILTLHIYVSCGRGRHGSAGLGLHALQNVPYVRREKGLCDRGARQARRRGSGH